MDDIKSYCDAHWTTEPHGPEPMRPDAGGRLRTYAPEGMCECLGCFEPATHTAGPPGSVAFEVEPTPRGHLNDADR